MFCVTSTYTKISQSELEIESLKVSPHTSGSHSVLSGHVTGGSSLSPLLPLWIIVCLYHILSLVKENVIKYATQSLKVVSFKHAYD